MLIKKVKTVEIVLASHSTLALGMYQTVSLIMGQQEKLHYITAYVDDDLSFKEQLVKAITPIKNEQIIFLTDVLGGSVNNELVQFVHGEDNYFLITGMNLPLVLELINYVNATSQVDSVTLMQKLQELVALGKDGLQVVMDVCDTAEDEDF